MILILAHLQDRTAFAVAHLLATRHGADYVRTLTAEELAVEVGWSYRHTSSGIETELRMPDGDRLSDCRVGIVFNRLRQVSVPQFESGPRGDRDYAAAEIHALTLSWLSSLRCPVVNRPSVRGLAGADRSIAEWLLLAGRAGLPARRMRFTTNSKFFRIRDFTPLIPAAGSGLRSSAVFQEVLPALVAAGPALYLEPVNEEYRRVLVVGEQVFGKCQNELREPVLRLARISGCDLLEVIFARIRQPAETREGWVVAGVNQFPSVADDSEIAAIGSFLESESIELEESVCV
jgi:hypothetical protein